MISSVRSVLFVITFGLVVLLSDNVDGQYSGYNRHNYPNPRKSPLSCGREGGRKSYVCDPDRVLGSQSTEANQLDELIAKIVNETKCPCSAYSCEVKPGGYKIGIALTKKMMFDDENNLPLEEDLDQRETQKKMIQRNLHEAQGFALSVLQKWNLGECTEDVIIFYSQDDNVVFTVTGDVARKKLTNELVGKIALDAKRAGFHQSGSPFDGLRTIVNGYRDVFLNSYLPKGPRRGESKYRGTAVGSSVLSLTLLVPALLASLFC